MLENWSFLLPGWVRSWLHYFGLCNKTGRLAFLGLDNAGKTSLVQLLSTGVVHQSAPTMHPTTEEVKTAGVTFMTVDLGGHRQARRVWRDYCMDVQGLVFLVDASDRARLNEARGELAGILSEVPGLPVAVLGNKVDRREALGKTELLTALGLTENHLLRVWSVSVLKRQHLQEPFAWLASFLSD